MLRLNGGERSERERERDDAQEQARQRNSTRDVSDFFKLGQTIAREIERESEFTS